MEFTVKKAYILTGLAVVVIVVAGAGFVRFSSTDSFCYLCHFHGSFTGPWEASAHYKAGVRCADCHIPHDPTGYLRAKWSGARDAVKVMNSAVDYDTIDIVSRVPDEECEKCHRAYRKVNLSAGEDMPFEMAIELESVYYGHLRHDEVIEICLRCHTKERSFVTANYMTCASCHAGLTHEYAVKYEFHFPSADRCSTCHNGRVHVPAEYAEGLEDGGTFFYNDCTAGGVITDGLPPRGENCHRCHPKLEPAMDAVQ